MKRREKMPRASAASLAVIASKVGATNNRPTLTPSRSLSKQEKQIFDLVVREHRHLRAFDAPLLTGYAVACAKMLTLDDPTDFEKVARVAMSLATRLRLTPQSGMQPVQLGRRYAKPESGPRPWDRFPHQEDDDDDK
jgi:hypothetical protein